MASRLNSINTYRAAILAAVRNGSGAARRVALLLRAELNIVRHLVEYGYSELEAVYIVRSLRV